jgi:hypothetical protein
MSFVNKLVSDLAEKGYGKAGVHVSLHDARAVQDLVDAAKEGKSLATVSGKESIARVTQALLQDMQVDNKLSPRALLDLEKAYSNTLVKEFGPGKNAERAVKEFREVVSEAWKESRIAAKTGSGKPEEFDARKAAAIATVDRADDRLNKLNDMQPQLDTGGRVALEASRANREMFFEVRSALVASRFNVAEGVRNFNKTNNPFDSEEALKQIAGADGKGGVRNTGYIVLEGTPPYQDLKKYLAETEPKVVGADGKERPFDLSRDTRSPERVKEILLNRQMPSLSGDADAIFSLPMPQMISAREWEQTYKHMENELALRQQKFEGVTDIRQPGRLALAAAVPVGSAYKEDPASDSAGNRADVTASQMQNIAGMLVTKNPPSPAVLPGDVLEPVTAQYKYEPRM